VYLLVQQRVHIGEFHNLEALARDNVYKFGYALAPNKIKGNVAGTVQRPIGTGVGLRGLGRPESARQWYTRCHSMPTKLTRIAVIKDRQLEEALDSVRELMPANASAAALVHDLAVRGAEGLRTDAERRRRLRLELADLAESDAPPWDPAVLADIDRLAWGSAA
jgi:hypothetical protein